MSNRIPIHSDGICPFHHEPVIEYDQCLKCFDGQRVPSAPFFDLPDPFEEVLGG